MASKALEIGSVRSDALSALERLGAKPVWVKEGGVPALDAAVCLYLGSDPNTANALRFIPDPPDANEGFRTHETILLSTSVF